MSGARLILGCLAVLFGLAALIVWLAPKPAPSGDRIGHIICDSGCREEPRGRADVTAIGYSLREAIAFCESVARMNRVTSCTVYVHPELPGEPQ